MPARRATRRSLLAVVEIERRRYRNGIAARKIAYRMISGLLVGLNICVRVRYMLLLLVERIFNYFCTGYYIYDYLDKRACQMTFSSSVILSRYATHRDDTVSFARQVIKSIN